MNIIEFFTQLIDYIVADYLFWLIIGMISILFCSLFTLFNTRCCRNRTTTQQHFIKTVISVSIICIIGLSAVIGKIILGKPIEWFNIGIISVMWFISLFLLANILDKSVVTLFLLVISGIRLLISRRRVNSTQHTLGGVSIPENSMVNEIATEFTRTWLAEKQRTSTQHRDELLETNKQEYISKLAEKLSSIDKNSNLLAQAYFKYYSNQWKS